MDTSVIFKTEKVLPTTVSMAFEIAAWNVFERVASPNMAIEFVTKVNNGEYSREEIERWHKAIVERRNERDEKLRS